MCRNGWGVLCVWLVSASLLTAAEPQPPGVPPQFAVVIKLDAEAGEVELRQTVMKPVNETVEQAITNPATGKVEIATFLRTIYVSEVRARRLKLADTRVITATQDAVEPDDVAKRLKPDTAVLLQNIEQKLDARYLATLNGETLIFLVKPDPPRDLPVLPGTGAPTVPRPR